MQAIKIVLGAPRPREGMPLQHNAVIAEILKKKLGERLRREVTVEYLTHEWEAAIVAPQYVARSEPDGNTLLLDYHAPTINAALGKLALEGLAPIMQLAIKRWVFAVTPSVPANSLDELVAYTHANPGRIKFTAFHNGAHGQLVIEEFKRKTGADLRFEPAGALADGISFAAASVDAIASGKVTLGTVLIEMALPLIRAGKLKPLAVTGPDRSFFMPQTPTVTEAGVPDANISVWTGLWAPVGTPQEIIAKLNRELTEIMQLPQTKAAMESHGFESAPSTTEQFAALIETDVARWKELIRIAGIRPEDV